MEPTAEIGRVIGMERRPNTAYEFYFWTRPEAQIGIGSLVRVVSELGIVYGSVVEAHGFNDLESPLHEFLSLSGNAAQDAPTLRPEMRVFKASVMRREPAEPVGAVGIGRVFLADEHDVRRALRTDEYADDLGIPCGCYGPQESPVAVHLHSHFLLGPEAGHLNVTGTSGLAAKTSYVLFLLKSILEHWKDDPRQGGEKGVAALLFNTKGGDLLYLDQEPNEGDGDDCLTDDDTRLYAACGVEAGPFKDAHYFAPYDRYGGSKLATLRACPGLESNPSEPLTLSLGDVLTHAEVVLSKEDLDFKADAYLQYLNREFVRRPGEMPDSSTMQARTIEDLVAVIDAQLEEAAEDDSFGGHHIRTMEKMRRRFLGMGEKFSGLIADGPAQGPLSESFKFEPGSVVVADVSRLSSGGQDLVFAAMIHTLRRRMEDGKLGVGRLIVMVDEMNKYAPSSGGTGHVAEALREIAARGRYLGLTLFGAQQFRSRVDKEVVGNAATHAFGHIESEELAQPGYSYLPEAVREKLRTLKQGEVLIKHPHFAQPVWVRFPRPGCLKGSDGMRKFRQGLDIPLMDQLVEALKAKNALSSGNRKLLDALSPTEDNLGAVLRKVRAAQLSEEIEEALRQGKRAAPTLTVVTGRPMIDSDRDPFETQ